MRKFLNWFRLSFYQYLFEKADYPKWRSNNFFIDWFIRLRCRIKGHPHGEIYYNPNGYKPDGRCKDCGDLII